MTDKINFTQIHVDAEYINTIIDSKFSIRSTVDNYITLSLRSELDVDVSISTNTRDNTRSADLKTRSSSRNLECASSSINCHGRSTRSYRRQNLEVTTKLGKGASDSKLLGCIDAQANFIISRSEESSSRCVSKVERGSCDSTISKTDGCVSHRNITNSLSNVTFNGEVTSLLSIASYCLSSSDSNSISGSIITQIDVTFNSSVTLNCQVATKGCVTIFSVKSDYWSTITDGDCTRL